LWPDSPTHPKAWQPHARRQPRQCCGAPAPCCWIPPEADLGDALIDASYQPDVELVVIGVRRRSPVGKLFLGSTSQRVILEAGCAVQAVKVRVGPRG
jgi:hypothetical protein